MTFPVSHRAVTEETVVAISASQDMRRDLGYVRVQPVTVQSVTAPRSAMVGSTVSATVAINAAMTTDTTVALSVGNGLSVPASVVVPAGRTSVDVAMTVLANQPSGTSQVTASVNRVARSSSVRIVARPTISSVVLPANLWGKQSVTGRVSLSHPSLVDTEVAISVANPAVQAPAKIVIPAGVKTGTFAVAVQDVEEDSQAVIAVRSENSEFNHSAHVRANGILALKFGTATSFPGTKIKLSGSVSLRGNVSEDTTVTLTSSIPGAVPETALIPAGSKTANFPVTIDTSLLPTGSRSIVVTATRLGKSVSKTIKF